MIHTITLGFIDMEEFNPCLFFIFYSSVYTRAKGTNQSNFRLSISQSSRPNVSLQPFAVELWKCSSRPEKQHNSEKEKAKDRMAVRHR